MTVKGFRTPPESRLWDVASIGWTRVSHLLDEGWEPFAVVQREPNTRNYTSEATVYLRRERSTTEPGNPATP